nr:hypothetical protein [Oscillochloris sp. ZM17-4]
MQRLVDRSSQLIELKRLDQKIGHPAAGRLMHGIKRRVAGHDNDRDRRIALAGDLSELQTAQARHLDIGEEEVDRLRPAQDREGVIHLGGRGDGIARHTQGASAEGAGGWIVVDDEDRCRADAGAGRLWRG